jgi:hypothetical protein
LSRIFLAVIAMKRNYQINDFTHFNHQELSKRIAYHEAGHATAIYLYNKYQQLPPIFFQINVKSDKELAREAVFLTCDNVAAKVEGGCLVQELCSSFNESQYAMTATEKAQYHKALDADMINLLAGAIAEANYVSLRDDEVLNAQLLTVEALSNYGSHSDLVRIDDYLGYLTDCPQHRQQKLAQLLVDAFEFMTHPKNWRAVTAVADFILSSKKQIIRCEEVFAVIDNVAV